MTPYYEEDGITIYHGDCREVLPEIDAADAVISDPPYGVNIEYGDDYDDTRTDGYKSFATDWLWKARRVAPIVAFTPGIGNMYLYPEPKWVLAWWKTNSMRRNGTGGFNMWQPILLYGKRRVWQDAFSHPTVPQKGVLADHPVPKPLELYRWLTRILTEDDALIVDPFMGSGTTLRAAKDSGRRAIGIEINEAYCEIAVDRLAQGVLEFS